MVYLYEIIELMSSERVLVFYVNEGDCCGYDESLVSWSFILFMVMVVIVGVWIGGDCGSVWIRVYK